MMLSKHRLFQAGSKMGRRLFATTRNPYEVLGIKPDASASEVKKAYFELAKKYHPDTSKEKDAQSRFVEAQNAYDVLSDPQKKAMYDQYGDAEEAANGQGHQSYYRQSQPSEESLDPSDILNRMFSGGMDGMFGSRFSSRPNPLTIMVPLSFLEAVNGCEKTIQYTRMRSCPSCLGSGAKKGSKLVNCKECRGSGRLSFSSQMGMSLFSATCPQCNGSGKQPSSPCDSCHGAKLIEELQTTTIRIPPGTTLYYNSVGVTEENVLVERGKGHALAGSAGNLNLGFKISPHRVFERHGNDIYTNHAILLKQALLGGVLIVPTIKGDVEIKISPGSPAFEVKRISKKGVILEDGTAGHHYARITVLLPKYHLTQRLFRNLDDRQKALMNECFSDEAGSQHHEETQSYFKRLLDFLNYGKAKG